MTIAFDEPRQPWDAYVRRVYIPNDVTQCRKIAKEARRRARHSRHERTRSDYYRLADNYAHYAAEL